MEDLIDPEEKITCPYNAAHHVRRCRMQVHLTKCRKSHADVKLVPCDFNSTHLIAEPELQYHHQTCSDRKKIEMEVVKAVQNSSKYEIPKLELDYEECWDNMNAPSYDPIQAIQNRDVLRHLDVESSAKKRNFRMSERQRLSELNKGQVSSEPLQRELRKGVILPPHREVANIQQNKPNRMIDLKGKLEQGANKVFQN